MKGFPHTKPNQRRLTVVKIKLVPSKQIQNLESQKRQRYAMKVCVKEFQGWVFPPGILE